MVFELPLVPSGLVRFAWHGVALALPAEWNLVRHEGTAERGSLDFADLRAHRLCVRWRTPRSLLTRKRNACDALRLARETLLLQGVGIKPLTDDAMLIRDQGRILARFADTTRVYDLLWPQEEASIPETIEQFLATRSLLANALEWPWFVYGIEDQAPAHARLAMAKLLPGEARLRLVSKGVRVTLASHSLADRLLLKQSLRAFAATKVPLLNDPACAINASATTLEGSLECRRVFRSPARHMIGFTHSPEANRIRWTHRMETHRLTLESGADAPVGNTINPGSSQPTRTGVGTTQTGAYRR